jgi:DNA-binding transcriptional LysR family regulator
VLAAAKQAVAQAQEAAKGDRGRLVIGSIGFLTSSFLPVALGRFREQRPLVEATALHMSNRAQVEAVLNGSVMLGIGFYGYVLEEDEQEQVSTRLLLRSPVGIGCAKTSAASETSPAKAQRLSLRQIHIVRSGVWIYVRAMDSWTLPSVREV